MLPAIPVTEKEMNKAYFSPGLECQQAIIEAISGAQRSLKICVFTISDDQITNALLAAHQRKIRILLLTDNEKLNDVGSDIRDLAHGGLEIRTDNTRYHMHHKFALIDNEVLLTGSYNWTRSAAMYNHENILVSSNKELVNDFLVEFDKLWQEMTPLAPEPPKQNN